MKVLEDPPLTVHPTVNTHSTRFKHDLHVPFNHRRVLQADDCCVVAHVGEDLLHQQEMSQTSTQQMSK